MTIHNTIQDAFRAILIADADVLELIGSQGSEPNILIMDVLPQDAVLEAVTPCILLELAPLSDQDIGIDVRRQQYRLRVYGFDAEIVTNLANRARRALHRKYTETQNEGNLYLEASGGISLPTDTPNLTGRSILVIITSNSDL